MENLNKFIQGIKEITGIQPAVFNVQGRCLFGDWANDVKIPAELSKTVVDSQNQITFFRFSQNGESFIGALNGVGERQKNLATFIAEFAEMSIKKQVYNKEEFILGLLEGEFPQSEVERHLEKFKIHKKPCYALLVKAEGVAVAIIYEFLLSLSESNGDLALQIDKEECVVIKFIEEDKNLFVSPKDYAGFLSRSIYEETGKDAKIFFGGIVKAIEEISKSLSQAREISSLGGRLNDKNAVNGLEDFFLIKLLQELPREKAKEYFEKTRTDGTDAFFSNAELLQTAEAFLENDLNICKTSEKLYLHRNTLTYRLDKIQRQTGLDIRKFSDAVTLRVLILINRTVRL